MIMISSTVGQRLARAKAALDRWVERGAPGKTNEETLMNGKRVRDEFREAAHALAHELIAGRHHEAEGEYE